MGQSRSWTPPVLDIPEPGHPVLVTPDLGQPRTRDTSSPGHPCPSHPGLGHPKPGTPPSRTPWSWTSQTWTPQTRDTPGPGHPHPRHPGPGTPWSWTSPVLDTPIPVTLVLDFPDLDTLPRTQDTPIPVIPDLDTPVPVSPDPGHPSPGCPKSLLGAPAQGHGHPEG